MEKQVEEGVCLFSEKSEEKLIFSVVIKLEKC